MSGKTGLSSGRMCTDPERERNHALGAMAASCHTCAMESTHGWEVDDRAYVRIGDHIAVVTIKRFDLPNGNAVVRMKVNGNEGEICVPIDMLMGSDLP